MTERPSGVLGRFRRRQGWSPVVLTALVLAAVLVPTPAHAQDAEGIELRGRSRLRRSLPRRAPGAGLRLRRCRPAGPGRHRGGDRRPAAALGRRRSRCRAAPRSRSIVVFSSPVQLPGGRRQRAALRRRRPRRRRCRPRSARIRGARRAAPAVSPADLPAAARLARRRSARRGSWSSTTTPSPYRGRIDPLGTLVAGPDELGGLDAGARAGRARLGRPGRTARGRRPSRHRRSPGSPTSGSPASPAGPSPASARCASAAAPPAPATGPTVIEPTPDRLTGRDPDARRVQLADDRARRRQRGPRRRPRRPRAALAARLPRRLRGAGGPGRLLRHPQPAPGARLGGRSRRSPSSSRGLAFVIGSDLRAGTRAAQGTRHRVERGGLAGRPRSWARCPAPAATDGPASRAAGPAAASTPASSARARPATAARSPSRHGATGPRPRCRSPPGGFGVAPRIRPRGDRRRPRGRGPLRGRRRRRHRPQRLALRRRGGRRLPRPRRRAHRADRARRVRRVRDRRAASSGAATRSSRPRAGCGPQVGFEQGNPDFDNVVNLGILERGDARPRPQRPPSRRRHGRGLDPVLRPTGRRRRRARSRGSLGGRSVGRRSAPTTARSRRAPPGASWSGAPRASSCRTTTTSPGQVQGALWRFTLPAGTTGALEVDIPRYIGRVDVWDGTAWLTIDVERRRDRPQQLRRRHLPAAHRRAPRRGATGRPRVDAGLHHHRLRRPRRPRARRSHCGAVMTDIVVEQAPEPGPDASPPPTGGAEPIVSVRGLTKRYGSLFAVRDLDLDVPRGATYGLIGPNGAGKTTTMSVLASLLRPTAGVVRVSGADPVSDPAAVRRRVGLHARQPRRLRLHHGRGVPRVLRRRLPHPPQAVARPARRPARARRPRHQARPARSTRCRGA